MPCLAGCAASSRLYGGPGRPSLAKSKGRKQALLTEPRGGENSEDLICAREASRSLRYRPASEAHATSLAMATSSLAGASTHFTRQMSSTSLPPTQPETNYRRSTARAFVSRKNQIAMVGLPRTAPAGQLLFT